MQFFMYYDNHTDPLGDPYWEPGGWIEAQSPEEALMLAKRECLWTKVIIASVARSYPRPEDILAPQKHPRI